MTNPNQVQLLVDGQAFEGWTRMEVNTSIEQMAGAFVLQVTLKWDGQTEPYALREGLPCTVQIGADVVITGYIDDYELKFDAASVEVSIHGRDKTADLVDCSAIHKTGQWRNVGLQQILKFETRPDDLDRIPGVTLIHLPALALCRLASRKRMRLQISDKRLPAALIKW